MPEEIKFGTDGWRAVIADEFTFENVKKVAQAACDTIRKSSKSRLILVGYDHRFFSEQFAETAARVALANGFRVEMSNEPIGSPVLSFQVRQRKAALGFMITASHNPCTFNGFKMKSASGGPVDVEFTQQVEARIDVGDIQFDGDSGKRSDFLSSYAAALKKHVSPSCLTKLKAPVVFDAMHGPGGKQMEKLSGRNGKLRVIRSERDPLFGGVNPEPIEVNLKALQEAVLQNRAAVGLAVDGDVDRIGVIDEKGQYLPPLIVMPLLLLHLIEGRKLKGKIIQTVSLGYLTQRIAKHFHLNFEEVPVGFKYVAKKMNEGKVLLGGEESGGYGVGLWFPERDGILCALLLLEMLAMRGRPLSSIVEDLQRQFGASHFKRVDFVLKEPIEKEPWANRIVSALSGKIAGHGIKNVSSMDGVKVTLEDDSWVLMRPSGTEPLIRTYSEGSSPQIVQDLLAEADRLAHLPAPKVETPSGHRSKTSRRKAVAAK